MLGCCERRWWCSTFEKYYYYMGCGVGQKRGNRRLHSVSKVVWIINILNLPPFSNKELQNLKNIIKYLAKKINKKNLFSLHNLSIPAFGVVQLLRTLYVLHKSRFDFMLGLMKSTRDKSHTSIRVSHPTIVFVHIVTLLSNILREIFFAMIYFSFIST